MSEADNMTTDTFKHSKGFITATKRDAELYENYYWVEPEALLA